MTNAKQNSAGRQGHLTPDEQASEDRKYRDLRGTGPQDDKQQNGANAGQNQNPGKGAPSRHLPPGNAGARRDKSGSNNPEETLSDGKGTEGKREDAALVKEVIRSRDA